MLSSRPHRLVHLLLQKNLTIATAESCTGGLIASLITDIPGASQVYVGGTVTYSSQVKMQCLDVPKDILSNYSAISPQTAITMAKNVRRLMSANIGLAVTGNLGPTASEGKNVGEIYIAVCTGDMDSSFCQKLNTAGIVGRRPLKELTAISAIELVISAIRGEICFGKTKEIYASKEN